MKLKLTASETEKTVTISYEDLNCTEDSWKRLSNVQKLQKLDDYVENFDQPYWDIMNLPEED